MQGNRITQASILTFSNSHALIIRLGEYGDVAVKSGFASGYQGAGASSFSYVLRLLESYGVEIVEYTVGAEVLERLDASALTQADLETLKAQRPRHPTRQGCSRCRWSPGRCYPYEIWPVATSRPRSTTRHRSSTARCSGTSTTMFIKRLWDRYGEGRGPHGDGLGLRAADLWSACASKTPTRRRCDVQRP